MEYPIYAADNLNKRVLIPVDILNALHLQASNYIIIRNGTHETVGIAQPTSENRKRIQVDRWVYRKLKLKARESNAAILPCAYVPVEASEITINAVTALDQISNAMLVRFHQLIRSKYENTPLIHGDLIAIQYLQKEYIFSIVAPFNSVLFLTSTSRIIFGSPKSVKRTLSKFDDIGGMVNVKEAIQRNIIFPIRNASLYKQFGNITLRHGFILYGPTGVGKSMFVDAIEDACNIRCIRKTVADIVDKHFGESERKIADLFRFAKSQNMPVLMVFEDFDGMFAKATQFQLDTDRRIISELQTQIDALTNNDLIYIIITTTDINQIDPDFRCSKRFGIEIAVDPPTTNDRLAILQIITAKAPLANVNLGEIAELTKGFVGSDLDELFYQAAQFAIQDNRKVVTHADFVTALKSVHPSVMREFLIEIPDVKMTDIVGLEDCKNAVEESVIWRLNPPDEMKILGTDYTKNILLYGPPGCGKTMLGQAIANEANCNFFYIKGPALVSKWVGESEFNIREIFAKAKRAQPSIIFIDEFDAISRQRGNNGQDDPVMDRMVNQLLTELNGLEREKDVVVIAATNRPDKIDSALIRTERFDSKIYVPLPNVQERADLFRKYLQNVVYDPVINFTRLAQLTSNCSGSDIHTIVKHAGTYVIRQCRLSSSQRKLQITEHDLEVVITEKGNIGVADDVVAFYESFRDGKRFQHIATTNNSMFT